MSGLQNSSGSLEENPSNGHELPSSQEQTTTTTIITDEKGHHPLTDQSIRLPPRKIISVFLACCLTDVCSLLDYTSLAIALSAVAVDLNAGSTSSWIASSYYVTSSSCQLLYSHLSDVWSRKVVLLALLVVFFLGSLASSLATTANQLIIFRAISGIGGGGLVTVAQVIVSDVVSLRERGKYQGILGAATALSNGIGPVLGASFSHGSRWRWIFRINLPLAILCALAAIFFMPLKKVSGSWKRKLRQIDFIGSALTLISSCLFILSFTWAGVAYPWLSRQVIVPLCFSALAASLFVIWEWKFASIPVMPLRIFKSSIVCGVLVTQAVNGWAALSLSFYLPQFYQLIYGYSPLKSACLLIPITVSQTFTSTLSGLVITWTGNYRVSILSGWAIWTAGLSLISTLDENSNLARQLSYSILTGIGIGCTFQASLIAIQGAVERRDASVVTAARGFFRYLFATVGLSVSGAILNNNAKHLLEKQGFESSVISQMMDSPFAALEKLANQDDKRTQLISAYRSAFRAVFLVSTGLAAMSLLCTFFFIKTKSVDRPLEDAKLQAEYRQSLRKEKIDSPLVLTGRQI
ncbi:hypothetical protein PGTUg99_036856 [Puccinia graminis f. sp. tritici]|uniref:Major facilitator superfamily (MFS) profile domain-containing protein n=1 Tax=Puccinia graminis f. sp. tritici TaxID=56615 RepID=A0A5B0SFN5_PUCGR|nr:hypothetical protein PGTUg99_036856 [Puccinia graminis f. sp. tritici]